MEAGKNSVPPVDLAKIMMVNITNKICYFRINFEIFFKSFMIDKYWMNPQYSFRINKDNSWVIVSLMIKDFRKNFSIQRANPNERLLLKFKIFKVIEFKTNKLNIS